MDYLDYRDESPFISDSSNVVGTIDDSFQQLSIGALILGDEDDLFSGRVASKESSINWNALKIKDPPERTSSAIEPIVIQVNVNGLDVEGLLDTGSQCCLISPDILEILTDKPEICRLSRPLNLTLAAAGSRSTVNCGALLSIRIGDYTCRHYADVLRTPKYPL